MPVAISWAKTASQNSKGEVNQQAVAGGDREVSGEQLTVSGSYHAL